MNSDPESKPQGSEQPLNPCQHCDESQVLEFGHSQGQIRVECPCGTSGPWCDTFDAAESQWNKVNPLPNPSADEEVEMFNDGAPVCIRCGITVQLRDHSEHDGFCDRCAHTEISKLRQQHNADREKLRHLRAVKEAWDDAYANHDGDVLKQTVAALKAELATAQREIEQLKQKTAL